LEGKKHQKKAHEDGPRPGGGGGMSTSQTGSNPLMEDPGHSEGKGGQPLSERMIWKQKGEKSSFSMKKKKSTEKRQGTLYIKRGEEILREKRKKKGGRGKKNSFAEKGVKKRVDCSQGKLHGKRSAKKKEFL